MNGDIIVPDRPAYQSVEDGGMSGDKKVTSV